MEVWMRTQSRRAPARRGRRFFGAALATTLLVAAPLTTGCDDALERARRLLDVDLPGASSPTTSAPLLERSGTLDAATPRAAYELQVQAGATLLIHLHSDAFDPLVEVTTPGGNKLSNDDFSGSRTDSELTVSTTAAGTLKVVAASVDPAPSGAFSLVVRPAGRPGESGDVLTVGTPTRGALGPGDATLADGRWLKRYLARVDGSPLLLSIRATTMGVPNALVVGPDGRPMTPAETGSYRLAQPGAYSVQMMSPGPSQTAGYQIELASAEGADAGPAAPPRAHHGLPTSQARATLSLQDERSGTLGSGAPLPTGEPADLYGLQIPADASPLQLSLSSGDFDAYLMVIAPDGSVLEDDDGGGGTDAELAFTPSVAGAYRVVVTSYRTGATGAYHLKVGSTDRTAGAAPSAAGSEQTLEGTLAQGDAQLQSGEFADSHTLDLTAGETVHLSAHSSDFDTYLIVRPPTGAQVDNDDEDSSQGTDAGLDFTARETGPHRIQVTSYRPGETGSYVLSIRRSGGGTPAGGPTTGSSTAGAPTPSRGGTVRGELRAGDEQLRSGEYSDAIVRQFPVGQPVSLRLTSTDFDPYLLVRTPSGQQLDNDDLSANTRDAGLDIASAERGDYRIVVTSYRPGETGRYELTVGASEAAPSTAPANGGVAAAPSPGGRRVFGVFAGISDYPGDSNDLPECANDARKLAETLERAGILSPERRVLLTDGQATRSAVRAALARAARELGPDDVFVFFWSGHGNRTGGSRDRREIDGMDESIVLYDGELMDDEMGQLFEPLHGRVAILALDSCYSGGFAKDVVTRPGVVGLFSSEEDVLSSVAGQFQAGGYLSHFLRTGMGGEADRAPRDGALTLGELTHYMHQQFAEHASDVRLAGAYQELVVDRGAVRVDTELWRFR